MNRATGTLEDSTRAEILQNIDVILTTPIGTRVMRRDFGSNLYDFIDASADTGTLLGIYGATYEAIARWEPRVSVDKVRVRSLAGDLKDGKMKLSVDLRIIATGETLTLDVSL